MPDEGHLSPSEGPECVRAFISYAHCTANSTATGMMSGGLTMPQSCKHPYNEECGNISNKCIVDAGRMPRSCLYPFSKCSVHGHSRNSVKGSMNGVCSVNATKPMSCRHAITTLLAMMPLSNQETNSTMYHSGTGKSWNSMPCADILLKIVGFVDVTGGLVVIV